MYDREELAAVYDDQPRTALFQLIDRVLALLADPDPLLLNPFAERLRRDGRKPPALVAENLLDELVLLLDPVGSERPLAWHLRRALHREDHPLRPRLPVDVHAVVEGHRALIQLWSEDEHTGFLYSELSSEGMPSDVLAHVSQYAEDFEAMAFLCRFAAARQVPLPVLAANVRTVLRAALAESAEGPEAGSRAGPRGSAVPRLAREWVGHVLTKVPESWQFIAGFEDALPETLHDYFERRVGIIRGALVEVDGKLVEPDRVDWRGSSPRFARDEVEAADLRWERRALFSAERLCLPEVPDERTAAIIALVRAHPELQTAFAERLRGGGGRPSPALVLEACRLGQPLLQAVVRAGWTDAIAGASELLLVAEGLAAEDATEVLLALGGAARIALGELVDRDISSLDSAARQRVRKVLDTGSVLDLAFWWKRLEQPGMADLVLHSPRARAALALEAAPAVRLVKRAATRPELRAGGLQVLRHWRPEYRGLAAVASEVLTLLATEEGLALGWQVRANVLAATGEDEALAVLLLEVERHAAAAADPGVSSRSLHMLMASYDRAWGALEGCGRVSADGLLENGHLLVDIEDLSASARRALLHLLLPVEAGAEAPPSVRLGLIANLVFAEASTAGEWKQRVGHRPDANELRELLRHPPGRAKPEPEKGLLEPDLADYVREFGEVVASTIAAANELGEPGRSLPNVLRRAMMARCRKALGDDAPAVLGALAERWPSPAALRSAARAAGVALSDAVLDRCADEALPVVFRACVALFPTKIDGAYDVWIAPANEAVREIIEDVWFEDPALIAKHLVPELERSDLPTWQRGVALALVALRETCGTLVPDALTRASKNTEDPSLAEFLRRQRDTFARRHVTQEQRRAPQQRTQQALARLLRAARQKR